MKHLRELKKHLERRYRMRVTVLPSQRGSHPVLKCRAKGQTVKVPTSGSPSDKRRESMNAERTVKIKFRTIGVELERKR